MAGFNTHLTGAAIFSGLLSSSLSTTGLYTPQEIGWTWLIGTLSGLLPDIDSDSSNALKGLFTGLGAIASLLVLSLFESSSIFILWLGMSAAFILVRFGLIELFARLTVHRGALHSLLGALMFGSGAIFVCHDGLNLSINFSWALGVAVFGGYLIHLVLDEAYSVDLSGMEIKRSFGSAIKPFSINSLFTSILFMVLTTWLLFSLPFPSELINNIFGEHAQHQLASSIDLIQQKEQDLKSYFN